MKIGIVSDTHDRHDNVRIAVAELKQRGIGTVLHCGDIEEPDTVSLFRGLTMHFVFGNCDMELDALRRAMAEIGAQCHEYFASLELGGKQIAVVHGNDKRHQTVLELCGHYDYLFHGHTHVADDRRSGRTRVINPGALHRAAPKTFVVLDLETGETESVVVG
jgi:putative phosphoesterase